MATFMCEMGKTTNNQTLPEDYEECIRENADLPRPSLWTYYIFHICGLISVLGAIVFQCSLRVQQRSMTLLRSSGVSLMNVLMCRICWRRRRKNPFPTTCEFSSSLEAMKEDEKTDNDNAILSSTAIVSTHTIISTLDSATYVKGCEAS